MPETKSLVFHLALCLTGLAVLAETPPAVAPPQETPSLPGEVRVLRAIPVEEPVFVDVPKLPRTLPSDVKVAYSQFHVEGNVIAITFDDGPHPQNTPRLLDMLRERNIKVTFFLIGKSAAAWPAIVRRIVAEGHEVANHTWTHPQLSHLKQTRVFDELQKTHDAIVKACGVAPLMYRPAYGAITISQRKQIFEHFGYPTVVWDVDPLDWRTPRSSQRTHDRILDQVKPGSIILCHDIHAETVNAMPSTLDDLIGRGYQFATVSQMMNLESSQAAARVPVPAAIPASLPGGDKAVPPATVPAPIANAIPVDSVADPAGTTAPAASANPGGGAPQMPAATAGTKLPLPPIPAGLPSAR